MPVLTKPQDKTRRVVLPSYAASEDPAWVEIYEDLPVSDLAAFMAQLGTGAQDRIVRLLCKMIKDWNFTDEEGKKLPVTAEHVSQLRASDMGEIVGRMEEIVTRFANAKKNTSF